MQPNRRTRSVSDRVPAKPKTRGDKGGNGNCGPDETHGGSSRYLACGNATTGSTGPGIKCFSCWAKLWPSLCAAVICIVPVSAILPEAGFVCAARHFPVVPNPAFGPLRSRLNDIARCRQGFPIDASLLGQGFLTHWGILPRGPLAATKLLALNPSANCAGIASCVRETRSRHA